MATYKWKIDKHPKGLGWIIYEWKNAKLSSWHSGNFSSEELAQTRLNKRKATLMNKNLQAPIKSLSKKRNCGISESKNISKTEKVRETEKMIDRDYYDNVFLQPPDDDDWEARDQDCEYWQRVMRDDYVP